MAEAILDGCHLFICASMRVSSARYVAKKTYLLVNPATLTKRLRKNRMVGTLISNLSPVRIIYS